MSLGFVSNTNITPRKSIPNVTSVRRELQRNISFEDEENHTSNINRTNCKRPIFDIVMIVLLLLQSALNLFGFAWVGLVLKWPIVYGDMPHSHPHEPHENYIWRPNNYLNILLTAFALDLFEPLWLLVMYCRNKGRTHPPNRSTYNCCASIFMLYSFLCLLLVGALCATAIVVSMSAKPSHVELSSSPSSPPSLNASHAPPPPPHPVIFETQDLYVLYVIISFVGFIKLISYLLGYPQIILRWNYRNIF